MKKGAEVLVPRMVVERSMLSTGRRTRGRKLTDCQLDWFHRAVCSSSAPALKTGSRSILDIVEMIRLAYRQMTWQVEPVMRQIRSLRC